ncbi:hypothetical protein LK09_09795 [Microbacterium mangrovi]|uniref:Erythromycin esterase n=1 Tax=Microbacterium mangrovi TaxID=1348253 RepID=A0A0B2A2V3_9MICO|nr:hypothetical protein LK09_09795 [Microbacterium mangrovi]
MRVRALRSLAAAAIDPSSIAVGDAEAVRALGRGGRVIAVGEAAHSVTDVQTLQDAIVRALVTDDGPGSQAIAAIALESGFAESLELDAWIGGAGADADLGAIAQRCMTYNFGASPSVQRMLGWLREWNRANPDRRVHVVGTDLPGSSTSPGPAVEVCLDRIRPHATDADLRIRADLGARTEAAVRTWRMTDSERAALVRDIDGLIRRVERDPGADAVAHRSAASLRAYLAELDFDVLRTVDDAPEIYPRERFMAETVLWIAAQYGRTIVLAHNSHVRRTAFLGRPTMGTLLDGELAEGYRVIATSYAYGPLVRFVPRSARPFDCDVHLDQRGPVPGSIEAAIEALRPGFDDGAAHDAVLLDLREGDAPADSGAQPDAALAQAVAGSVGILAGGDLDPVDDFPATFDALVHLHEARRVPGAFERLRAEFGMGVPDAEAVEAVR